jgi:serine/threonine-protein kinase
MLQKNTGGIETIVSITPATTKDSPTSAIAASEPLIRITPTTARTGSYPLEITDGSGTEMVFVPAGKFIMGSNNGNPDEKPVHSVYLDDFYIDKYEVTNRLYRACVKTKVCDPPKQGNSYTRGYYYGNTTFDNYPVVNIDWSMGQNFCQWRGARLPTEAEWEKAARGTDERIYPWGNSIDCSYASYMGRANGCVKDTSQVGKYQNGISLYGAFDMAGNVWEWVSSLYLPYPYSPSDRREDLSSSGNRVLRGGSWNVDGDVVTTTHRYQYDPASFDGVIGFRCVSSP